MKRKWFGLLAVVLFGLTAWVTVVVSNDTRQATQTLTAFVDGLTTEEGVGAGSHMAIPPDQSETFISLLLLAANDSAASELPALLPDIRVSSFGLPGVRRGTVGLAHANGTTRLSFTVRRTAAGWRVTALPDLLAHPAAYSLNGPGGNPSVLMRGRAVPVSGGAGLPTGNQVAFVVMVDGKVVHAQPSPVKPVSRVLRLRPREFIETEREGLLPLAWDAALYDATGARPASAAQFIPGTSGINAYFWHDVVYGVAATKLFVPDTIRVLLGTTDFGGLTHGEASVSSPTGLTLTDSAAGSSIAVGPGARVTFRRVAVGDRPAVAAYSAAGTELARSAARLIVTAGESGRITLHTVTRGFAPSRFNPSYRGRLEVAAALPPASAPGATGSATTSPAETGLNIISEAPLDQYLYAVVPSEMPVSYGAEALKVQALAARAYAVASMTGGGYVEAGAHVDDSTSSQVYGNIQEQPASNEAVDATSDLVPVYQGEVVDARFFSTSYGFTANSHEVWSRSDGRFPGTAVPYLSALPQTSTVTALPNEQSVRAFIGLADLDAPDAASPWFRWTVTMTSQEFEAALKANLSQRQQAQPGFVLTRDAKGNFLAGAISGDPIGTLTDIRVIERGAGGNIMTLEISGTGGVYQISKEYNIRMTLKPVQYLPGRPAISTVLRDGSNRANYGLLPSAFAVFDLERQADGTVARVTIRGGGNGHGAGMSQEGARGLALRGWTYDRIVAHYYPGTEIVNLRQLFPR